MKGKKNKTNKNHKMKQPERLESPDKEEIERNWEWIQSRIRCLKEMLVSRGPLRSLSLTITVPCVMCCSSKLLNSAANTIFISVSESFSSQECSPYFHRIPLYKASVTIHIDSLFLPKTRKQTNKQKHSMTRNSGPALEESAFSWTRISSCSSVSL